MSRCEQKDQDLAMERVKILAERIDDHIKVKIDFAGNYDDGRLPILDLKVWIGEGIDGRLRILYTHYAKEVSSRAVMGAKLAHGQRMKHNVMMNEVCRVMRNCSEFTE